MLAANCEGTAGELHAGENIITLKPGELGEDGLHAVATGGIFEHGLSSPALAEDTGLFMAAGMSPEHGR